MCIRDRTKIVRALPGNEIYPVERTQSSLPLMYMLLHKGLFKIVANSTSDEQSLWWVVRKQTNDELVFKQLITFTDVNDLNSKLKELEEKLNQEIQDRQTADDAISVSYTHLNGYTITGDNYFFLNYYQLMDLTSADKAGAGRVYAC